MNVSDIFGALGPEDTLTVALSVLGGAVSGLLVFALDQRSRRSEEKKRVNEERKGLLLLLRSEITLNNVLCEEVVEFGQGVLSNANDPEGANLSAIDIDKLVEAFPSYGHMLKETALMDMVAWTTWDSAKVRLTQLLDAEQMEVLLSYYALLQEYAPGALRFDFKDTATLEEVVLPLLAQFIEAGEKALDSIGNPTH